MSLTTGSHFPHETPKPPKQGKSQSLMHYLIIAVVGVGVLATVAWAVFGPFTTSRQDHSAASVVQSDAQSSASLSEVSQSANAPQSASSHTDTPQSQATPAAANEQQATAVLDQALARTAQALATTPDNYDASDILAESALEDLQAAVNEWELLGYRQEGVPTIVDLQVTPSAEDPSHTEVLACIDYSKVRVLNEEGAEVSDAQAPTRSRLLFEMARIDGTLKIVSQSFPEDPDC